SGPLRGIAASRLDLCLLVFNFAIFTESHSIPISVLSKPTFEIFAVTGSANHTKFGAQNSMSWSLSRISRCRNQVWTLTTDGTTPTGRPRPLSGLLYPLRSKRLHAFSPRLKRISRRGIVFGGESHLMSFVIISHFRARTFHPAIPFNGGMPGKHNPPTSSASHSTF
ncbi:hypothetical protein C8F04DRAFT_169887, partial [Mycena alexandri]